MKRYLFFLLFLLISQPVFAYKYIYNPHSGRLDAVGVSSVSGDITALSGECSLGEVIEFNGTIFECQPDDTSSGGGSIRVSEDGTFVVSADTLNFTTGIKATTVGSKVTVSSDIATTTTPGIASFDATNFSVGPFGGVSIKNAGVNLADEVTGTLPGASFPALSGDVLTNAGQLITTIDVNKVTYAKMQDISTTDRVLGRSTAGSGDPEEITFSDAAQDFSQDTFADDQAWIADSATAGTPRTLPNCTDTGGQHLNYTQASNAFSCGTTGDGGGSGSSGTVRVSEDGTAVVSADVLNFTTGIKATNSGSIAIISGDMATTTTPGIASFDSTNFSVGPFGGVSIKNGGVNLADEVTGILPGASFPALSGDVLTNAGSLITTIDVNSVALGTDTTGNYVATVADGTGIDGTATGEGSTYTPVFDSTEVTGNRTWADGTDSEKQWTHNLAAGDPVFTFKNGSTHLSGNVTVSGDLTITGDDLFMTTNTDRFALIADGTNYNPEAIDLGTDTTGNYVATVAASTAIVVTGSGSETAAVTVSWDRLTVSQDALSSTTATPSGIEIISNRATLLQGCTNNQILGWTEATDTWGCTDQTGGTPSGWTDDGSLVRLTTSADIVQVGGGQGNYGKFSVIGTASTDITALIHAHTTQTAKVLVVENGSSTDVLTVSSDGTTVIGSAPAVTAGKIIASPPDAQALASADTITANGCGTLKRISGTPIALTTNTTNTFTAPAATNAGCIMTVVNLGPAQITLDNNANFKSAGGADVVMTTSDVLIVASSGNSGFWYQVTALEAN